MRSGELRELITLWDAADPDGSPPGRDAAGGSVAEWVNERTVYAKPETTSGREYLTQQGVAEEATTMFTFRYDPTFTASSKIVWNGVTYNPRSVRNVGERDRTTEVVATRGAPR